MYGKIVNGALRVAPKTITAGHRTIANPPPDLLIAAGWLPVIYSPRPETDAEHYPESRWEQAKSSIMQVWTVKPLPPQPPSLEQRIADLETIITGEGL